MTQPTTWLKLCSVSKLILPLTKIVAISNSSEKAISAIEGPEAIMLTGLLSKLRSISSVLKARIVISSLSISNLTAGGNCKSKPSIYEIRI